MEYQIQSTVLVDGEWVSRTSDVYQIMARNHQDEDDEMQEPVSEPPTEPLQLGILSRTVIESSLTKFILPANVRHKYLNDVLFVGEDSVHLKEVRDYGHLLHVASKTDFKGKILAARVFGQPRRVLVNTSEQSPLLQRTSVHRARRSDTGDEGMTLPPEVIVLTLNSRTLMFLWVSQTPSGSVIFRQRTIRLPAGASRFDRPGPFLAVDPRCRAIAVAAHEGCFVIYKTKTMDQWREQSRFGQDEIPIEDEALVQIEGRIMHMEFLCLQTDVVSLVVIVVHDGHTKLASYTWDLASDFGTSVRKSRSFLGLEDRIPSLLIPLHRSAEFLLVCDRHVSLYTHILSGPPSCEIAGFPPHILTPLQPGASKGIPRWVQWAKAPRNPDFTKEAFYIAREDGMVVYVERGPSNAVEIVEAGSWPYPMDTAFACLNADNSEFAQSSPDVLISGGIGSDGHLCRVGSWPKEYAYALPASESHVFSALESVPNWAPLTDLTISRSAELRTFDGRQRASIYIANGDAPHGQISELRRGLRALVDDSFEGMKGCTGVYIVDLGMGMLNREGKDTKHYYVTFLATFPLETVAIRAARADFDGLSPNGPRALDGSVWEKMELPDDEPEMDGDSQSRWGLVKDEETISACAWNDNYAIQITRSEARSLTRPALNMNKSFRFPHTVLQAVTIPTIPFIAAIFRHGSQNFLQLIHIQPDGAFTVSDHGDLRFDLPCEPSCMELLIHEGAPYVFLGTIDCKIRLLAVKLRVHSASSMAHVYEGHLESDPFKGLHMVCESAVMLSACGRSQLVCGTRNGLIVSISLDQEEDGFALEKIHITKMGTTAVQVSPCATDYSCALVACGSDFCRLRVGRGENRPIEIDSIWFCDPQDSTYSQGPVTAVNQLAVQDASASNGRDLGGFMLAVSGERMVFAQLDYDVRWPSHDNPSSIPESGKVIPRSLLTTSTPKRLLYLGGGEQVVVATIEYRQQRPLPHGVRTMQSSIKLVNRSSGLVAEGPEIKRESGSDLSPRKVAKAEYVLKDYERVYSMIEWKYTDPKGKGHLFVIIGTGTMEGVGKELGRRLIFKVSERGLKHQTERAYRCAVRCLAMYDKYKMVFVYGKTLQIEEYDTSAKKFLPKGSTELPSAGVHLSVHEAYICVSTAQDSFKCFRISKDDNNPLFSFVPIFCDSRQRQASHHLVYSIPDIFTPQMEAHSSSAPSKRPRNTITLLADKTCCVSGLLHSQTPVIRGTADTLFEACLPRSVIRLHRGDVRPPWRRPCRNPFLPSHTIPGVLADDILGACSDGTIYAFSILSQPACRLLRLLQNLVEEKRKRDPALKHSIVRFGSSDLFRVLQNGASGVQEDMIMAMDVDPEFKEKGDGAVRFKHVDGDLVARILDEVGVKRLVCEGCDEGVGLLFEKMARALMREGGDEEDAGDGDLFAWVKRWTGEALMPLL